MGSVAIPVGVRSIGNFAFASCGYLSFVTIPNTVTSIGQNAFSGSTLTSIELPASDTTLGQYAFSGCNLLTGATILGLTSIPDGAFASCARLAAVTISSKPTSIGRYAFYECPKLISLTIPDSVTTLGSQAFQESGLISIAIPSGVTSLSDQLFQDCFFLRYVVIPSTVTSFGLTSFSGCYALTQISFLGNAPNIDPDYFGSYKNAVITYPVGASGWTNPFAGIPATPASAPSSSARLTNISTRAQVGTGGNILIPGFEIGGIGTETLLVRADGPSLTPYNVPGLLAQPSLAVYDSGQHLVASNTGWGTSPDPSHIAEIAGEVGAFPFQPGSADCAILVTLPAGQYTVQVSGVNGTTGVSLAEVYEVTASGTARLTNISTRAQVGTGGNVLIPGFVVAGSGTDRLLVRADGPSLTQFGVQGVLANPELSVFDDTTAMIASNAGWGTSANPTQIENVGNSVGAFALTQGSSDSAQVVNLAPGAYTMQVSGVGGTTGVSLAEVYEVP